MNHINMTESNDSGDIKDTQISDDLDNLQDRALDDSTELENDKSLETKDDSKETSKEEVEDTVKKGFQANSKDREMFEEGSEEFASLFQELLGGGTHPDGSLEDLPPSMQSIMQLNLSTDTYCALMKEIPGKYIIWLKKNKDILSSEQYDIYCKQLDAMRKLHEEIDAMSESEEVRPLRIRALVERVESLGPLPPELGDVFFENMSFSTQSIMQSFLSKDTFYPKMKEYVGKYSVWFEKHKDSLSPELYDDYCRQSEVLRKVVEEFETERESDDDEVKKQRLQRIVDYLQQVQSFLIMNISSPVKVNVDALSVWLEGIEDTLSSENYDHCCQLVEVLRMLQ